MTIEDELITVLNLLRYNLFKKLPIKIFNKKIKILNKI